MVLFFVVYIDACAWSWRLYCQWRAVRGWGRNRRWCTNLKCVRNVLGKFQVACVTGKCRVFSSSAAV